jgi:hypothetical protein
MKLTALAGSPLYLELYVIGEGPATHPALQSLIAERFAFSETLRQSVVAAGSKSEALPGFEGELSRAQLGHPELNDMLWTGCYVTRLVGEVGPEGMADDFTLAIDPGGEPMRARFYSSKGVWSTVGLVSCFVWIGACTAGASLFILRGQDGGARKTTFESLGVGIVLIAATLIALPLALPGMPVKERRLPVGVFALSHVRTFQLAALTAWQDRGTTDTPLRESLNALMADYAQGKNPLLGGKLIEEDSPGNYRLEEVEEGVRLTVWDDAGCPHRITLGDDIEDDRTRR